MQDKLRVSLVSLAFPDRDLSPALVLIKRFAQRDERIARSVEFTTRQYLYSSDLTAIGDELIGLDADLYAFSCYVWNIQAAIKLCGILKEALPRARTLLGGPEAGPLAKELLAAHQSIDMIIAGEGELPFRAVLKGMLDKRNLRETPGLWCRDGDTPVGNPPTRLIDLTAIPSIQTDPEYVAHLNASPRPVTAAIETARGCPFRCRYCSWGNGTPVRFRSMDDIHEDLRFLLAQPKVRRIYITDGDLLIDKRRAKEILRFLARENQGQKQIIFEMNPELLDDETITIVSGLSSQEFAFGLQSTSPTALKATNRRFRPERYCANVARLRRACPNAEVLFSLIVGLPRDTLGEFRQSLDFAISMRPHSLYIHELLCLPGSEFHANQEHYGIQCSPEPPHRLIHNETFPKADRDEAKWLGYHVSLLHYVPGIAERLWSLHREGNCHAVRLVDLYDLFSRRIDGRIDLTCGKNLSEVPSFDFDDMYARTVQREDVTAALRSELEAFMADWRTSAWPRHGTKETAQC